MSTEAVQQPSFGGREEYNQTPLDRLEECEIITDAIDTILHSSLPSSGSVEHGVVCDAGGVYIQRSFRYLEGDTVAWPLAEKVFTIVYSRSRAEALTHETYTISARTLLHQQGISNYGMQDVHTIEYFGADRSSATSVVEQPNFVEPDKPNMVTRATTPYDQIQLFNEVVALQNAIDAGEREHLVVTAFNNTPD